MPLIFENYCLYKYYDENLLDHQKLIFILMFFFIITLKDLLLSKKFFF